MNQWLYLPPWGVAWVIVAAVALVALLALRAARERRLVVLGRQAAALVLRVAVIAAVIFVALNPNAVRPQEDRAKPSLVVLVDTSSSMATGDVQGKSRIEAVLDVLGDRSVLSRLEEDFVLDVRSFDKQEQPLDLVSATAEAASGRASDIASALTAAVRDQADKQSQAGVLLVSDGRTTTEGATEAARLALARSVPVWTWCLGGEVPRRDLWLEVPSSEVLAFAGAEVELAAVLHADGYEHRSFRVDLLADGRVLGGAEAVPDAEGKAPVNVRITAPQAGEHQYTFRVADDEAEADRENNERAVFLRVVGEKVRVLLAEGQPHWDSKFLVQSLKRNPRVDLTAVYRLGDQRQFAVVSAGDEQRREQTDLFPRTAEQFAHYDVVILGRSCETFFDERTEELLGDSVARNGGSLVFARGKAYGGRFLPLAKLEPVVWGTGLVQRPRLSPTSAGRTSPVFELAAAGDVDELIERLAPLDQVTRTVGVKPLAVVLAEADSPARQQADDETPVLMAYQEYGQGRVVTLNASGIWRWAFRERASEDEELVYDRFWSAMLRWLLSGSEFLAGSDVALRSERRAYTDEQPLRFLVRTRRLDEEAYRPRLSIHGPGVETDVEPRRQAAGSYMIEAGPLAPGDYQIRLTNNIGSPPKVTMNVTVVSASTESRVLSADPQLMRRLAETSEGHVLSAGDVAGLGRIVEGWRASRQLSEQRTVLWDRWPLLAAILVALAVEFYLRRREGLL